MVVVLVVPIGVTRCAGVILVVGDRMRSVPIVVWLLPLRCLVPSVVVQPGVSGDWCGRSHVRGAVERAQRLRRHQKEERE